MRISILLTILSAALSTAMAGNAPVFTNTLSGRPARLAYHRQMPDDKAGISVYNFTDSHRGAVFYWGDNMIGYCPDGNFDLQTAPPALVAMLESVSGEAPAEDTGKWTEVLPLQNEKGYVMWNQDSPFNDLCPEYGIGQRSPSGCVATAMAQMMFYHQWPEKGTGSHTYSPVILAGNTLTADFGNTKYGWDKMLPYYSGTEDKESRAAVAELMLHCGVAVDMVYYSQSGATDYDVPPALVNYFNYDRGLAYRKREHYSSSDWLNIIHHELEEGRPVLAYGKSSMGGHAFVFDGMDSNGFIHVNWGWGGMSNGYFNTSVLTPPVQGIGGADGGFNYSQRIITGIRPAGLQQGDYHVEITSTESLSPGRKKIKQGEDVKIKLSGKVYNHGWRDAEFDYALILSDAQGKTVRIIPGPEKKTLAINASDYAPDFGSVSLGELESGEYILAPAVRSTGASGEWIRVRDEYIGYPNMLRVNADENEISFAEYDYFDLRAVNSEVPEVIWDGIPALITTDIVNDGDVEYHGEVRAALFDGSSEVGTTSNYIIDLGPGEKTTLRFTDSFSVATGNYTLAFVNDDGQKISSPVQVEVKTLSELGNVSSAERVSVIVPEREKMMVKAVVKSDALFQGLLYAFIYDQSGNAQQGCLYPEYISLNGSEEREIQLNGEFENGVPGRHYKLQLAVYSRGRYTFLEDDNSNNDFILNGESSVSTVREDETSRYKYYDFNGFEVDPRETKLYKKVKIK